MCTLLLASACGGGAEGPAGGATFTGTFEVQDGVGPGEISFTLDGDGERIVSATIDPAVDFFVCPEGPLAGVGLTGGGRSVTYTPGLAIEGDSFEDGAWVGVFDSPTEAHGTYSLEEAFDCPAVFSWTATSE